MRRLLKYPVEPVGIPHAFPQLGFTCAINMQTQTFRQQQADLLSSDLDRILAWGRKNFVTLNSSKTQTCTISCKKKTNECNRRMDRCSIIQKETVSLFGVSITNNHYWYAHVSSNAKSAACKLGFSFVPKGTLAPKIC